MATQLKVVGILVPTSEQRQLIESARNEDIANRLVHRWFFQRMVNNVDTNFLHDQISAAICKVIYNPTHRNFPKTLRYKQ